MTVLTRAPRRRRGGRLDHRLPDPDLGPHVYMMSRLDAHLTLMQALRRELDGTRRLARPGSRLHAAAASALAAQHYAADIANALAVTMERPRRPVDRRPSRSE